jgi:hypothetical protein
MVTPTNATASFQGLKTGRFYNIDIYISDVVSAKCTLNAYGAAVAGSDNFVVLPEDAVLIDLSVITGPTVMVGLVPTSNGAPLTQYNFRIANFLSTLTSRTKLGVGFKGGNNIGFIQY